MEVFLSLPLTTPAQGPLAPTGAPTPTMKTLAQVEARTPIAGSTSLVTISAAGTYYLTGNIAVTIGNGLNITVSDVALDLNGFTISSTASPADGYGIQVTAGTANVTIQNGNIRGTTTFLPNVYTPGGFSTGIRGDAMSLTISQVYVAGTSTNGIFDQAFQAKIVDCTVTVCSGVGIAGNIVSSCVVKNVGSTGISGQTISSCTVDGSMLVTGINGNTVSNCNVTNSGSGIAVSGFTINNCYGNSAGGSGISAAGSANNCYGTSTSGIGINAPMVSNCYGSSSSNTGIQATTVTNSFGNSSTNIGISADTVNDSRGISSVLRGISGGVVSNSIGVTNGSSFGVYAAQLADASYGGSNTGTGIYGFMMRFCRGQSNSGAAISYSYRYDTPDQ